MKILHIGDWHLGVKKDDSWVQKIQSHGIESMIAYSLKNGITTWIQYGDLFDVRAHTTQKCMEFTREQFDKIEAAGIVVHTIIGNHDCFHKSTLYPNTTQELLAHRSNVVIYDKPTTVDFDGCEIDLIPWMLDTNTTQIMDHIKQSSAEYCIGHWELNGFYFYKGMKSHGLEPDFLKKYKQVWSGHFHTISSAANVKYIGTPWTLTAGDENDPRGFWVQDTRLQTFDFIPNEVTWHRKIFYPVTGPFDANDFKNLAVRIIITSVDDKLPAFESELEKVVHELRTVSKVDNSVETEADEDDEVVGLLDMMMEYIEALPDAASQDDIDALKALATQLYIEASA